VAVTAKLLEAQAVTIARLQRDLATATGLDTLWVFEIPGEVEAA
jgi:hypothetical protein